MGGANPPNGIQRCHQRCTPPGSTFRISHQCTRTPCSYVCSASRHHLRSCSMKPSGSSLQGTSRRQRSCHADPWQSKFEDPPSSRCDYNHRCGTPLCSTIRICHLYTHRPCYRMLPPISRHRCSSCRRTSSSSRRGIGHRQRNCPQSARRSTFAEPSSDT